MKNIVCPLCSSKAVRVTLIDGYKYYCRNCGWNLDVVRAALSMSRKVGVGLVVFALVLAVLARLRNPGDWSSFTLILVGFSGLPLFYALWAVLQVKQLQTVRSQTLPHGHERVSDSEAESSVKATSTTILFQEKSFPELALLSRPRKLRMTVAVSFEEMAFEHHVFLGQLLVTPLPPKLVLASTFPIGQIRG